MFAFIFYHFLGTLHAKTVQTGRGRGSGNIAGSQFVQPAVSLSLSLSAAFLLIHFIWRVFERESVC